MSRRIAVIIGAGPGLAASLARTLSATHSLLLLSRSLPGSLPKLELNLPDDIVHAASSDGSRDTLDTAFAEVKKRWPEGVFDVGIFNTGGNFSPGKFLEKKVEDLRGNLESGPIAAFNFAQVLLPLFLSNKADKGSGAKGTLVFTGATMAMRGGAIFSTMAPPMFARRALSQSLAREFGPQGVHVAHVVVDGGIYTPGARDRFPDGSDKFLDPEELAKTYVALIAQHKSVWTQELDTRPYAENW